LDSSPVCTEPQAPCTHLCASHTCLMVTSAGDTRLANSTSGRIATRCASEMSADDEVTDSEGKEDDNWVDGLRMYRFRADIFVLSDPGGVIGRGTGTSVWSAGEVLSDFFSARPELYRERACLELGAGIGAVGMTLAVNGASLVVLTDVEEQLPLLRRNVAHNFYDRDAGVSAGARRKRIRRMVDAKAEAKGPESQAVHVRLLDWRCEDQRLGLGCWNKGWSLIVGSDIGYDRDLFGPLIETLAAQCGATTSVYLALADRTQAEEPGVADFVAAASGRFRCLEVHARQLEPFQSVTKVLLLTQFRDPALEPAVV